MSLHTTDSKFEEDVLKSDLPVLVDFWAKWCGPCLQLGPVVDEVGKEMAGKIKVVKMDVDENPETPGRYAIRSIPSLIIFKNGKAIENKVGSMPKSSLVNWIENAIGKE